eukprot:g9118.t1
MTQVEKRGENGGSTARAAGPLEASLDLVEELFVSCRFTEAARGCNDALASAAAAASTGDSGSGPGASSLVVTFDDQFIAPVGECVTADLIVAVLLQCGFELRRTEEWRRCRAYYGESAMPFAVGILWLRLRLAGGEFELVRRVLWQLRAALGEELLHCATTTAADNKIQGDTPHDSHGTTTTATSSALANYSEATEMLVVQIMLPCGESGEASALVSNDRFLGANDKSRLLRACELSAARTPSDARESGTPAGGADATARATTTPALSGNDSSQSYPWGARRAASGRPERDRHTGFGEHFDPPPDHGAGRHGPQEQGPVQKFFSDVSDWTPEARIQLVVGAGAAGLAAYAAMRNRDSLLRAARGAASAAARTAGDIGAFIVGSS